ncbi:DUF397 domain-containing protein [Hamadaea tsunoensis]|uniref:DUF397 domain-containing protein n=1 Tax=Hamadaea tsunoensis TaxID=53368 RepID=UPI0003F64DBF|nr:DUF397 domain-containing protein [Hamadaea tsunoensis]
MAEKNSLWKKSSRCDTSACVEVAEIDDAVGVRQSEDGDHVLIVSREAWRDFAAGVKDGEFDRP